MTSRTPYRIKVRGLCAGYAGREVLHELNVDIPADSVTAIIGPNGCGKSTLLRTMSHLLPIKSGSVTVDGVSLEKLKRKQLSQMVALLPQSPTAPEGLLVSDLVSRGRHPHQTWLRQWSSDDEEKVAQALNLTGAQAFAERQLDALSGGQRQRVWISMVLAQDTNVLFLDEPTTYLDQSHSIEILDLVHRLTRQQGKTVVLVLHDLNLALRYADHLVIMDKGHVAAAGTPGEIISSEILSSVFRLNAIVIEDPITGGPLIVPKAPHHIRQELQRQADEAEQQQAAEQTMSTPAAPVEPSESDGEQPTPVEEAAAAAEAAQQKVAELTEDNKKAATKARKLAAKAAKFDSELEEIDESEPDRDKLIDTAAQAQAEAAEADRLAQEVSEKLVAAKTEAAAAQEHLDQVRNES